MWLAHLIIKLKNPSLHSSNHTYLDLLYEISSPWNLIQKIVFCMKSCSLETKWEFLMNVMSSVVPSGKSQIYNYSKATPLKKIRLKCELNWTKFGTWTSATVPEVFKIHYYIMFYNYA